MKNRYLLSALLTMLLCCFMTSVDAQCTKTKKSCSKSKTEQTKKSCDKAKSSCTKSYEYSSCSKYKKSSCGKKNQTPNSWNTLNTLVALGAVSFNNDNASFTTGLEYERQVGNQLGLGLLSEVTFGEATSVKVGIPVSYHLGKFKLSAAPMGAFQEESRIIYYEDVIMNGTDIGSNFKEEKEITMALGARVGVSYLMNLRGLVIAPTVRADYLGESIVPNVGINIGFGF